MPTPSADPIPAATLPIDTTQHRNVHATCPPEDDRNLSQDETATVDMHDVQTSQPTTPPPDTPYTSQQAIDPSIPIDQEDGKTEGDIGVSRHGQQDTDASEGPGAVLREVTPSPMSAIEESSQPEEMTNEDTLKPQSENMSPSTLDLPSPGRHYDISNGRNATRYMPSFLRHGSKFVGTQQSDRQEYNVEVEIKHVDIAESFICGYLRIEGLTADHPSLTTYFEGEIIGNRYTFQTRHEEWGSDEKIDFQHWNRFSAWKPLSRAARRPDFSFKNFADRENIFMRWKEYFLVPDHKVKTISGASFEGFYYICFNQLKGTVSGIYFHSKSEKYQQLELRHVDNRGCLGAVEFR